MWRRASALDLRPEGPGFDSCPRHSHSREVRQLQIATGVTNIRWTTLTFSLIRKKSTDVESACGASPNTLFCGSLQQSTWLVTGYAAIPIQGLVHARSESVMVDGSRSLKLSCSVAVDATLAEEAVAINEHKRRWWSWFGAGGNGENDRCRSHNRCLDEDDKRRSTSAVVATRRQQRSRHLR